MKKKKVYCSDCKKVFSTSYDYYCRVIKGMEDSFLYSKRVNNKPEITNKYNNCPDFIQNTGMFYKLCVKITNIFYKEMKNEN